MFDTFLKSGLYLRGWSPKTVEIYRRAFTSYQRSAGAGDIPSKAALEAWVLALRERGVSPAGVNIYIRAMNSYSSWLKEEGHIFEKIRTRQAKTKLKTVKVLSAPESTGWQQVVVNKGGIRGVCAPAGRRLSLTDIRL